ncbi:MAG: hypothetical protein ACON4W_08160 [Parvibaculales bacterium]
MSHFNTNDDYGLSFCGGGVPLLDFSNLDAVDWDAIFKPIFGPKQADTVTLDFDLIRYVYVIVSILSVLGCWWLVERRRAKILPES